MVVHWHKLYCLLSGWVVGGILAQAVMFIEWLGGWWYTGTSCTVYWVVGWLVVHWHKLYCLLGGWVVGGRLAQAVLLLSLIHI